MNKKLMKDIVKERNSNALLLDNKFDDALIGTGIHTGENHVAVYDSNKCIEILLEEMEEKDELAIMDAYDQFRTTIESTTTLNKPIFISDFSKATVPPGTFIEPEEGIDKTINGIIQEDLI